MIGFDDSGKISSGGFKDIIQPYSGLKRKEVLIGPTFGVDTAVLDLGNNLGMAISSDPLSLIPSIGMKASAWLSVHLLANDLASTGFAPMYVQMVLNLPSSLSIRSFEEYWKHIHAFCEDIGVAITGGHTGRIERQESTISGGGTMFLTAPLDKILSSNQASPRDKIVVTKETALTSSSILAMSFPATVRNKLGLEVYQIACENFYQTSSLKEALLAAKFLLPKIELKAMHDVTEGGVIGAICELAQASGCGFRIDNDLLPLGEAQKQITDLFQIDHRFCVGAGSMIMVVKPGKEIDLVKHLQSKSIKATVVGEITPQEEGYKIVEQGQEKTIDPNIKDPYWEAFFKAYKAGLK
jgi:hydrogenase maturation factor